MKRISLIFLIAASATFSVPAHAQGIPLEQQMEVLIASKETNIGVSVVFTDQGKAVAVNGNKHYPMQSVYKFHLALAVLDQVDKGKLALNQLIQVKKKDLLPNTWSPMRDKYPDGNVSLPLSEILRFTVSESDNNGCDILFRLIGGPKAAQQYIAKLGIKDCAIVATEEEMHKDSKVQFTNWTTPNAATALLKKFVDGNAIKPVTAAFLMKIMEETTTGPKKIKGLLPAGTLVAHKTGYSGVNKEGITAATNDIGIITLPDGRKMLFSAFVTMSEKEEKDNDQIIAELAALAFEEGAKSSK